MRSEFLCAAALLAAAGAGPAAAADIAAVRPVVQQPVASPPHVPEWVGFYLGIHGGGGWDHTTFDLSPFPGFGIPNSHSSGGLVGGQAGYNWQWGPVVGGLELDITGTDIKETATFVSTTANVFTREQKIDALGSVRGRLGYLIFPTWLIYGTAGLGFGHSRLDVTDLDLVTSTTSFQNEFGWVAGAGVEWMFAPRWILRGEWLHYDFGRVSHADLLQPDFPDVNTNVRTQVDVARAALSYKF
jgi:outer membrane immunogenic protein